MTMMIILRDDVCKEVSDRVIFMDEGNIVNRQPGEDLRPRSPDAPFRRMLAPFGKDFAHEAARRCAQTIFQYSYLHMLITGAKVTHQASLLAVSSVPYSAPWWALRVIPIAPSGPSPRHITISGASPSSSSYLFQAAPGP